jgi:hypothetical protein
LWLTAAERAGKLAWYEVLAGSGLTTQVTHQRFVIVSNTDSAFEIDGAEVHRRPVPWMNRLVREGAVIADGPGAAVPRLRPGAALADLAKYGPSTPDADDIDLEPLEDGELVLLKRLAKGSELLQNLGL